MPEQTMSRRRFLGRTAFGIGAAIVAGWITPAVAFILGPARKRARTAEWRVLGRADKVELGTPSLFKAQLVAFQGDDCVLFLRFGGFFIDLPTKKGTRKCP